MTRSATRSADRLKLVNLVKSQDIPSRGSWFARGQPRLRVPSIARTRVSPGGTDRACSPDGFQRTLTTMEPRSPKYPPVAESDQPGFARRVVLELGREDYYYLWEAAQRVSQLLGIGLEPARLLTARACADLVLEEASRSHGRTAESGASALTRHPWRI
jgi:hypothetical protein